MRVRVGEKEYGLVILKLISIPTFGFPSTARRFLLSQRIRNLHLGLFGFCPSSLGFPFCRSDRNRSIITCTVGSIFGFLGVFSRISYPTPVWKNRSEF